MIGRIATRLLPPVLLLAIWIGLQGSLTVGNVVGGILVVAAVSWIAGRRPRRHVVHPWGTLKFGVIFLKMLAESTWSVAVMALRPTPERLRAGVVACPLANQTPLVATIVADAITLTPGTLTLDVRTDPTVLYVHAVGFTDAESVRADVADLERLVVAAVEPRSDDPTPTTSPEDPA